MMYVRIEILDFNEQNDALFIVFYKEKNKMRRLCLGRFSFELGACSIFGISPLLLDEKYFNSLVEELAQRDWDKFKPGSCQKEIREYVRRYNKQKYNKHNPFRK